MMSHDRALIDAAVAINAAGTVDDAFAVLAQTGLELLGAARASIAVWDDQLASGVLRAGAGEAAADVGAVLLPGKHAAWEAVSTGRPVYDLERQKSGLPRTLATALDRIACVIAVPLEPESGVRITFQAGWLDPLDDEALVAATEMLVTLGRLTAIARRTEDERDQAETEASLEATIEVVAEGVLIRRGDDVRLNDAARRMFGLEAGQDLFGLLHLRTIDGHPVTREESAGAVAIATGEDQRYRYRVTTDAGKELVLDGTASPTEDGQGFVSLFRDVTTEHEREFLNQEYLRRVFDAIPTAILLVDPATRAVVSGNRAFCELTGYELDDVIGCLPPYPWWADSDSEWSHGDEPRYERLYRRSDDRLVPVHVDGQTIRDHDGRALSRLALITDLSERRRLEQQLVQSGKLAAIGELAAGVAHEINNPLFAILGLVEFLMKDAEPGSKTLERLLLVQQTGLEIKEIVRSLLDFARENSEERQLVVLEEVVFQTVDLVRRTSASKGVELIERYDSDAALVNASSNQIKQIFLNLLANARQATPAGGPVTIDVRCEADGVLATVTDSGVGIPEDLQSRIFEPFFTTKRDSGGTGLGLSVSLGIAEAHGGSLTLESKPGHGAAFTLRLPRADEGAA
jgi:PAS domain S-box-containing protein